MGDDKPAPPPLNGWQKRDVVENNLKDGDSATANRILQSISPENRAFTMKIIASKAQDDTGIHKLEITNGADGDPVKIKSDKLVVTRQQTKDGDVLSAEAVGFGAKLKEAWHHGVETVEGAGKAAKDMVNKTELGDAVKRGGTPDSEQNRKWNKQIQKAEGGGDS